MSFIFNNNKYNINDIVLYKTNKNIFYEKYIIKSIKNTKNEYIITLNNFYDNCSIILDSKKLLKSKFRKYIEYENTITIYCDIFKKDIYKFKCEFCNCIHKYNKLGYNEAYHCIRYHPYKYGFNLKLNSTIIGNFNDYLLFNFELYLRNNKGLRGWSTYVLSLKKFVKKTICEDYGSNFPYINNDHILYIKQHYKKDNIKCSKGALTASLKKYIEMITNKSMIYEDSVFNSNLKDLYIFYNIYNDDFNNTDIITQIEQRKQTEIILKKEFIKNNSNTLKTCLKPQTSTLETILIPETSITEEFSIQDCKNIQDTQDYIDEDKPTFTNSDEIIIDICDSIEIYITEEKKKEIKQYIFDCYNNYGIYNNLYYGFKNIIPPTQVCNNIKDNTYSTLYIELSYMGDNIFDVMKQTTEHYNFMKFREKFKI